MTVALCFITWNEIEGCRHDVPLFDFSQFDQIYCIDGGSTDGTVEFLEESGIEIFKQTKKGLNQACIDGAAHCKCDAFVFFHPKGTIPVEDTYRFRHYFEQGYDLVIGSRMVRGAVNEEDGRILKPRKWFVLGLALFAKLLYNRVGGGGSVWDVLHGFRGMTKAGFEKLSISNFDPSIDIEMVCRCYKKKMKCVEFPTRERPRIAGETHFKAISTGKKLIKYMFWEMSRKD